jgi:hypothetical protein
MEESRNTDAILAHTVKRYINGYLYNHWNQHRMKKDMADKIVAEMERLETKLRSLSVTDKQIDQLLNYGQIHISLTNTAITEPALRTVMRFVFSKDVGSSL